MGATAVDVRRILHGFALRAAIAAALGCQARTGRMLAFVGFLLSHIGLLLEFLLLFDAAQLAPEPVRMLEF
jgi:hypothetical protein